MSERSSYISDNLAYFGGRQREVAAALATHLGGQIVHFESGHLAVAGLARASHPGGEWEDFQSLPPFGERVSIVINCEGGAMIRLNLQDPSDFRVVE